MNEKIIELYDAIIKDFDKYVFQYKGYEIVLSEYDYAKGSIMLDDLFIVVITKGNFRDYTYISKVMIEDKEFVFSVIDHSISTF